MHNAAKCVWDDLPAPEMRPKPRNRIQGFEANDAQRTPLLIKSAEPSMAHRKPNLPAKYPVSGAQIKFCESRRFHKVTYSTHPDRKRERNSDLSLLLYEHNICFAVSCTYHEIHERSVAREGAWKERQPTPLWISLWRSPRRN